jgi:Family of unknown function (DUF5670)
MRFILLGIAIFFVIVWVLAFVAFHVAGFLIHILLVLAVIFFIVDWLRPRI